MEKSDRLRSLIQMDSKTKIQWRDAIIARWEEPTGQKAARTNG